MTHYRSPIVLMYHGTPNAQPESHYSIHADLFAKHLRYLQQEGWTTVLFKDLQNAKVLPEKCVAITFDDGYEDNYPGAFLPLMARDLKATWFITTDCMGGHAHWLGKPTTQTRMLTAERLLEMHAAGMEIASHTCSHPDLSVLSPDQQHLELSKAKTVLEDLLSTQVSSLAYPFGRFNADSVNAAEQTGYSMACTTRPGWFDSEPNRYMIRRIAIFSGDSVSTLARKLNFADNDVSWNRMTRYYAGRIWDKLTHRL